MKSKKTILCVFLFCALLFSGTDARETALVSSGDRSEDVVRVQKRLFDLGYYTYKPTGSYGSVTKRAVQSFQADLGKSPTGELTYDEWKILFSDEAPYKSFVTTVQVTFPGQSETLSLTGEALPWDTVKNSLTVGETYAVYNAADGTSCRLTFAGGTGHGEFTAGTGSVEAYYLEKWLGTSNDFYKIACVMEIDGVKAACSMQWDGKSRACVYFYGSTSHVNGLRDTEHETLILRAAGLSESEAEG